MLVLNSMTIILLINLLSRYMFLILLSLYNGVYYAIDLSYVNPYILRLVSENHNSIYIYRIYSKILEYF